MGLLRLMGQTRFTTRRAILCLVLLICGTAFAAGPEPDGWVVAINGKWTRAGKDVQQYDAVFVKDKLQGNSGKIEVALKDGQSPHLYPCDKPPCNITIPGFRPAPDSLLARLGRAFGELASHRDTMPVSAISRGSEQLRQAVLPFDGGRLDLKDAVRSIDTGTYTVSLRPIARAAMPERLRGSLSWDPPAATAVSFPTVAPGLYELTMASSEGDTLGSVAVLVASPADYPAKRKSFETAALSLPQELDPVALDAFLSALLFDIGSGSK